MDHMGVDAEYAVTSTRRLSHIVFFSIWSALRLRDLVSIPPANGPERHEAPASFSWPPCLKPQPRSLMVLALDPEFPTWTHANLGLCYLTLPSVFPRYTEPQWEPMEGHRETSCRRRRARLLLRAHVLPPLSGPSRT